jgi:glycosyltransferase involved in cell wall biosynthesis
MKILYAAIDQSVPDAHGGSVHVTAVAEGLAALGHQVQVLATPGPRPFPGGPVEWRAMRPPFGVRQLRFLRAPEVLQLARSLRPDVVIERYYNFGGEGLLAARRVGALAVLEVNAPIVDYPGSRKRMLDALLIVQPMRRWRDWQCRAADLIVTPSIKILPGDVSRAKVLQTEWGADTVRFHPGVKGTAPFPRTPSDTVVVFVGAFRPWHGAIHLVDAIRRLRDRGRSDIKAVLIGDGPELAAVRQAAEGLSEVVLTGPLPHDQVPAFLAAADIGAAPFDLAAHPPLAQDFYWSPLKIFEYMASGLPVVCPRIPRLAHLVRDGEEGVLYDAGHPVELAGAIERLADPGVRRRLGAAARARAVEHFSWEHHCLLLDASIRAAHTACAS